MFSVSRFPFELTQFFENMKLEQFSKNSKPNHFFLQDL